MPKALHTFRMGRKVGPESARAQRRRLARATGQPAPALTPIYGSPVAVPTRKDS